MTYLSFQRTDKDGVVSAGRLMIDTVVIPTPNFFASLRNTQSPNELDLIIGEKAKAPLEHVSGAVIRMYDVPTAIESRTKQLVAEEMMRRQLTIDGSQTNVDRSPYAIYYKDNLPLCDPALEYTKIINPTIDRRFRSLNAVPLLRNYFVQFEKNRRALENPDYAKVEKLRTTMYDNLWTGSSKSSRKDKDNMLTELTKYQLQHFRIALPGCYLIVRPDDVQQNIENNDFCQALTYQANKEKVTYFLLHRNTIKNEEITGQVLDYLRENKESKLNAIKFKDLNLHCPVDYKARKAFKSFEGDINSIKEENPDRAFMMIDAGPQYYVASQVFDIVSTTLRGFDRDITGGNREEGKKYYPLWYDEKKMWPRPTDDAPKPDPNHCYICSETPHFSLEDDVIARRKRIHVLNDLNQDAKAIYEAVSAKDVGRVMRARVAFAEFSYARDLILSP